MASKEQKSIRIVGLPMVWLAVASGALILGLYVGACWLIHSLGEGAIVLLHGINSHWWDGQAPDLTRRYSDAGCTVLLFGLRGHGYSGGNYLGLGWQDRGDVRAAGEPLAEWGTARTGL